MRSPWWAVLVLLCSTSDVDAGAVDRTCSLDAVVAEGGLRIALAHPRTCPPGDLVVTGGPKPFVLEHALWSHWIGHDQLPIRVGNLVVWLQADGGDRALLRTTRVSDGVTTTLGRGSFLPYVDHSGTYVAVAESHDPLPRDITLAIAHRVAIVDLSDENKPVLAAPSREVPGGMFEHFLNGHDAPGAFWFLLTGGAGFTVARWHAGITELVTLPGSGSYANIAIDARCGNVAVSACSRTPDCTIAIASLDGVVSRKFDLPTRAGPATALPWEGEVTRLRSLRPEGVTYEWMSLERYSDTTRTIAFTSACRP